MTQEFVTLPREVVEQVREALSLALSDVDWRKDSPTQPVIHKAYNAATSAALGQPQGEQEPVAWYDGRKFYGNKAAASMNMANMSVLSPVYLHQQPKREPLTDKQRRQIWRDSPFRGSGGQIDWFIEGTKAAERAHNIK